MIISRCVIGTYVINEGKIETNDASLVDLFSSILNPFPGPSEGDPDLVLNDRMNKYIPDCEIVEYIPMKIDSEVEY